MELGDNVVKGFAVKLADNFKKSRDKAVKKLRRYVAVKSKATNGSQFELNDLVKLWKGIHYCMWMADKTDVQAELSRSLSQLTHQFATVEGALMYFEAGMITQGREWNTIDKWRRDKFMMFVRHILREALVLLHKHNWSHLEQFTAILSRTCSCPTTNDNWTVQHDIKYHVADIYLDELERVAEGKLTDAQVVALFKPYNKLMLQVDSEYLAKKVLENVFFEAVKRVRKQQQKGSSKQMNGDVNGDEAMDAEEEEEEEDTPSIIYNLNLLADSLREDLRLNPPKSRNKKLAKAFLRRVAQFSGAVQSASEVTATTQQTEKPSKGQKRKSSEEEETVTEQKDSSPPKKKKKKSMDGSNVTAAESPKSPVVEQVVGAGGDGTPQSKKKKKKKAKSPSATTPQTDSASTPQKQQNQQQSPSTTPKSATTVVEKKTPVSGDDSTPKSKKKKNKNKSPNTSVVESPVSVDDATPKNKKQKLEKSLASPKSPVTTVSASPVSTDGATPKNKKQKKDKSLTSPKSPVTMEGEKSPVAAEDSSPKTKKQKKDKSPAKSPSAFMAFTKSAPPPAFVNKSPRTPKTPGAENTPGGSSTKRLSFILSANKSQSVGEYVKTLKTTPLNFDPERRPEQGILKPTPTRPKSPKGQKSPSNINSPRKKFTPKKRKSASDFF